jgi:glycosyltransferase involved in cell wall biosynthesis
MAVRDDVLRLLVLTDTAILGAGGSERFLRNLLARLPAERYSIDVLQLTSEPPLSAHVGTLDNRAVRLTYHPIGPVYGPRGWAAWRRVRKQLRETEYHIVQSQHEKSDLINALLPRRRGTHTISNRRDMGFQKSARVNALFRRLNGRFDRIIAPAQGILDKLVADENADAAKCRAIPNGVDTTLFAPVDSERRSALRAVLGFSNDDVLLGSVASFTPVKRHVDVLAAFANVRASHSKAQLVLIGDGPLCGDVEKQIAELRLTAHVSLLGARSDIDRILPALDAFVLASNTEGLSNAILEAQACALPVVATNVGGNPDLVRPGETGWLVPAENPQALASALNEVLAHPQVARDVGAQSRMSVQRDHSVDAMAAAYERLYRELAHAS